jgi:HK97 family phage portal protein
MAKKARKSEKLAKQQAEAEQFAQWSVADHAFAAWIRGEDIDATSEVVTPYTVLGLSAVLRAVSVISGTIADLPLRTYERQGDNKVRTESVFDDPYPGIEGMTRFEWVETVLIHLLLWRNAYLWHDARDARTGDITIYRPLLPDAIKKVERVNGRKVFTYLTDDNQEKKVGSEWITHIPGPSLDGVAGHPFLHAARAIFSGAISGDKTAQLTLRRGIRLAGLLTPADNEEDVSETEGNAILESLRANVVGREHAGDVALINKRMKLQPWTPNNIESQWAETRQQVLGEIERLFGVPAHLMGDTEKQTSWGTGVAEQNLGLSRFTLKHWSTRVEQVLSRRLPADQFVEFDYKGLLQGTPAEEIRLVIEQVSAGLISLEYACTVLNLPAPSAAQKAVVAPPAPTPLPVRQEATA